MDQPGAEKRQGPPAPQWTSLIWFVLMALALVWLWQEGPSRVGTETIPYSQFKEYVKQGDVVECAVRTTDIVGEIHLPAAAAKKETEAAKAEGAASATTPKAKTNPASSAQPEASRAVAEQKSKAESTPGGAVKKEEQKGKTFAFRTVRVDDPELVADLEQAGVKFTGVTPSFISEFFWMWILPIGVIALVWIYLSKRLGGLKQSVTSIGASRAKLVADTEIHVTFNDVAGCDEAKNELREEVEFLKHPAKYQALGAKIPKGVLLVGPPGTGKTLLARAVAGEAKVPFFSISGSEFVEMFVGVGAARVRDLFQQAKKSAPCIVFIDELDAVGRQRGVRMGMANDEREQTLNQLLVGLDGFEANLGVVVLAATNRPEILDHALLRPGRFDRQVVVDAPDLEGRDAILRIHSRGMPFEPDVDLRKIAQETPGFSGADLANVINEAALLAGRHSESKIGQKDLEEAVEKVIAGPERKSRRLSEEDKRRVAYHETGHALVGAYSKHADVLRKITIVPRGRAALGYTLQVPGSDRYLMSRAELLDKIKGLLGGRAAEEVVFPEVTTGAENDLEHATALARQMVCMYGMSKTIGLLHCGQHPSGFLAEMGDGIMQRDCSEQTAREIDQEVKAMLDTAYREAKEILTQHRDNLDLIAGELLKSETMDAQTFQALLARPTAVVRS